MLDAMFEVLVQPQEHVIDQGDDGDNFYVIERYMCFKPVLKAVRKTLKNIRLLTMVFFNHLNILFFPKIFFLVNIVVKTKRWNNIFKGRNGCKKAVKNVS